MDDLIPSDLAVRFYPVRHHDTNSGRIQIARAPGPSITATRMFTDNAALTQQLLGQLLVLQPSTAVTTCLVPELQQLVDAGAFPGSNKRLYDDEDGVSQELLDRGLVQKCAPGQWQLTVAGVQQLDQTLWLEPTGKVFTPRAVKVDDLSQLECQLELERRGWQMNNLEDNRQGAFAPFKGGSKVWYTDKSGAFFITYARCLLKWDELRADHVESIFHGQISAYYQALLQCSPDKRPSVVPWKPATFYRDLMTGNCEGAEPSRAVELIDDFSIEREGKVQNSSGMVGGGKVGVLPPPDSDCAKDAQPAPSRGQAQLPKAKPAPKQAAPQICDVR